ncbi:hypothetical protein [Senegalia massiliensis]|nr:hypothetical protein [Senegalia massiliensis]
MNSISLILKEIVEELLDKGYSKEEVMKKAEELQKKYGDRK